MAIDLKKIRTDYYWYRFRKGRAEILLEQNIETGFYYVPFRYVTTEEKVFERLSTGNVEDDGDLVLIEYKNASRKMKGGNKEWISLDRIKELNLLRNESSHITCNIYRFFLRLYSCEKEPRVRRQVEDWLDEVRTENALKHYKAELQDLLDGNLPVMLDAYFVKNPDPELVRKEMETLELFRIHKPKPSERDYIYERRDTYDYYPIDLDALGAQIGFVDLSSIANFERDE